MVRFRNGAPPQRNNSNRSNGLGGHCGASQPAARQVEDSRTAQAAGWNKKHDPNGRARLPSVRRASTVINPM
jgi:hypothetical protein